MPLARVTVFGIRCRRDALAHASRCRPGPYGFGLRIETGRPRTQDLQQVPRVSDQTLDMGDDIGDRVYAIRDLRIDLDLECLLEGKGQLDRIEAVRAKIVEH